MNEIVWANSAPSRRYADVLQELGHNVRSVHWSRAFEWPWVLSRLDGDAVRSDVLLEAGGGSTPLQYALARRVRRVVNLDGDQCALDEAEVTARERNCHNLIHRCGDLLKIPYADATFDVITCISVVEHIENSDACIDEIWRVLKPGGRLLLTVDVASYARWNHSLDLAGAERMFARWGLVVPAFPPDGLSRAFEEIDPSPDEPKAVDLRVLCAAIEKPVFAVKPPDGDKKLPTVPHALANEKHADPTVAARPDLGEWSSDVTPFFRRGHGPLVSVLVPTRERPDCRLDEVVTSCLEQAHDRSQVEILVKVDDDDQVSSDRVDRLSLLYPGSIKKIVMPRGRGYLDIDRYINGLYERSTGDWLWLLGDNTKTVTYNWDEILRMAVPVNPWVGMQDIVMLKPSMPGFPFLRRKSAEIMGCVTPVFGWDLWLLAVMGGIQCTFGVGIHLEHLSSSPLPEGEGRRRAGTVADIFSTRMRRLMHSNSEKLLLHLEQAARTAVWDNCPPTSGWYIWRAQADSMEVPIYIDVDKQFFVAPLNINPCTEPGQWCADMPPVVESALAVNESVVAPVAEPPANKPEIVVAEQPVQPGNALQTLQMLSTLVYPSLHLDVFSYCNASCNFCLYPTMTRKKGQMSWELLRSVVAQLQTWEHPTELALMHFGEFFLCPDWREILTYISETIPHFPLVCSTNGSMIDDSAIDAIVACKSLRYLNFSVYADSPDEYKKLMGLPAKTLDAVEHAVKRLRRERPDMVLEIGTTTDEAFVPASELVRVQSRWAKEGAVMGIHSITRYETPEPIVAPCSNIFNSMVVLHDGRVAACCHDANGDLIFGDATKDSLLDIWNGDVAKYARRLHNEGRRPDVPLCHGCTHAATGITSLERVNEKA